MRWARTASRTSPARTAPAPVRPGSSQPGADESTSSSGTSAVRDLRLRLGGRRGCRRWGRRLGRWFVRAWWLGLGRRRLGRLGFVVGVWGNADLPAGADQVRVGQRGAVRLDRVTRRLEERRIAHRVTQLRLGDVREGVTGAYDVLLSGAVRINVGGHVRHLEHRAGDDEVGAPVEFLLVELDDLGKAGTVAEEPVGDSPQAVAALDGVVDGRRLRRRISSDAWEGRRLR